MSHKLIRQDPIGSIRCPRITHSSKHSASKEHKKHKLIDNVLKFHSDDENDMYMLDRVVGEEILPDKTKRYLLRWEDWREAEDPYRGANTAWANPEIEKDEVIQRGIKRWDRKQQKLRDERSRTNTSIDLRRLFCLNGGAQPDASGYRTAESAEAYEEKLACAKPKHQENISSWLAVLQREPDFSSGSQTLRGSSADTDEMVIEASMEVDLVQDQQIASFSRLTKNTSAKRARVDSDAMDSSEDESLSQIVVQSLKKVKIAKTLVHTDRHCVETSDQDDEDLPRVNDPYTSAPSRVLRRRNPSRKTATNRGKMSIYDRIAEEWSKTAAVDQAARLTITPLPGSSKQPPFVGVDFDYLERAYHYQSSNDRKRLERLDDDCGDGCLCGGKSSCHPWNLDGRNPYLEDLFLFNLSDETPIIECYEDCACDEDKCSNRAAQQPRDIVIDIFETRRKGWGVRSREAVKKGKILGIFTGELLPEQEAPSDYVFDLHVEGHLEWAVSAKKRGNWTRWINHSCAPNCKVWTVYWDTDPREYAPYLAFIATEDIPPMTELTIDYNPTEADGLRKVAAGHLECRCGSQKCRGYVVL